MRCRARRSLAVKRLLISRGIRRVAAQATKRAAVLAACCADWSAVTESRFQNRYNPGLARPAVRLDDTMAATPTLQSLANSAPFSSTGGRPIHANGEQAVGTQRAAGSEQQTSPPAQQVETTGQGSIHCTYCMGSEGESGQTNYVGPENELLYGRDDKGEASYGRTHDSRRSDLDDDYSALSANAGGQIKGAGTKVRLPFLYSRKKKLRCMATKTVAKVRFCVRGYHFTGSQIRCSTLSCLPACVRAQSTYEYINLCSD